MVSPYKTFYTPVERYHRMMARAANSAQAEALLRGLVVFQTGFGRDAIIGVAPDDMDEETRIAAFATLRSWRVVRSVGTRWHRFTIDASIKNLFPVTDDVRLRQIAYYISIQSTYNSDWIQDHQRDLDAALQWAEHNTPIMARFLAHKIRGILRTEKEHNQVLSDLYTEAQRINNKVLQVYVLTEWDKTARRAKDWAKSNTLLEQAIDLSQHINHARPLVKLYLRHGGEVSYTKALAMAQKHHWRKEEASTLWRLQYGALQRHDLDALRGYFLRLKVLDGNNLIHAHQFGRIAAALGEIDQARDYFARDLASRGIWLRDESLWSWGQMEYQLGNKPAGRALCQMALGEARNSLDIPGMRNTQAQYDQWLEELSMMACDACDE